MTDRLQELIENSSLKELMDISELFLSEIGYRKNLEKKKYGEFKKIYIDCDLYDLKRFSHPWCAKIISWDHSGAPEFKWGKYRGGATGGKLIIEAHSGDIIRWGQKHRFDPTKTRNKWGIINNEGCIEEITPEKARELYREKDL